MLVNSKTIRKLVYIVSILLLSQSLFSKNKPVITKMMDEYFYENLKFSPFLATQSGFNEFNHKFDFTLTDSVRSLQLEIYKKYKKKLAGINKDSLGIEDQLNYELLNYDLDLNLESFQFPDHYLLVDQLFSFPLSFMMLGTGALFVPFETLEDYNNWLKRVEQFPRWVDYAIENMNKGIKAGVVQPRVIVEAALPQFDAAANEIPEENIFYGPIKILPVEFSEEQKREIENKFRDTIKRDVSPAYKKLISYLKEIYLPNCRESLGISELPNGKEWYKHRVKIFTSTELLPNEIHEIGLKEVARIEKEMNDLWATLEEGKNTRPLPGARFYTREELLQAYRNLEEKINKRIGTLFSVRPKTPFDIRPVEEFRVKYSSSSYTPAPPDGVQPGIFYLQILGRGGQVLESLFLHEAIPGHHFQISLQRENNNFSDFRKFSRHFAFLEGWGLYVESLGEELGLYKTFFQKYARYVMEMTRAIRLVVDTGIHAKGWTIEQVTEFIKEKNPARSQGAYQEALRYVALGGQALAYKIGELKIHELIDTIKKKYPGKFNLKDFHDKLLLGGGMPIDVFEKTMLEWAQEQYGG